MEMTNVRLTEENVNAVLESCLYAHDSEPITATCLVLEGLKTKFAFDVEKLEAEKANIEAMLSELPEHYKEGWSFMELYYNKNGEQWTGLQRTMEALMLLGVAIGKISYIVPKQLWWSLPGGMPYLLLNS